MSWLRIRVPVWAGNAALCWFFVRFVLFVLRPKCLALVFSILRVAFFFDQLRAEFDVDLTFDCRAFVVGEVHGASELDELLIELLMPFLLAKVVFDYPEFLID